MKKNNIILFAVVALVLVLVFWYIATKTTLLSGLGIGTKPNATVAPGTVGPLTPTQTTAPGLFSNPTGLWNGLFAATPGILTAIPGLIDAFSTDSSSTDLSTVSGDSSATTTDLTGYTDPETDPFSTDVTGETSDVWTQDLSGDVADTYGGVIADPLAGL